MIQNPILAMPFGDITPTNIIIWLIVIVGLSVLWMVFMPQIMGLQAKFAIRGAKKSLEKLEDWSDDSKKTALKKISQFGRTRRDVEDDFEEFLEFFTIEPVSTDPSGVLDRLEHVLDVRKKRFEEAVERFAPEADSEEAADIEMVLQGALANYTIYKTIRHYIKVSEKTNSMQLAQMLQMMLPMLEKQAKAYNTATNAFADQKVIGDGVGPMIASKIIEEEDTEEEIKNTVFAKTEIEGRRAYVVKAKGPGGRVGKPGELIKKLSNNRKLDRIFMLDAGLKLEGEQSGKVVEGVGAAIGGPPTEKHKIEELATRRNIPVDAIVVKEGLEEAITPMTKEVAEASEEAISKLKRAIRKRTEKDDVVFVAGIGNTIGVSQNPEEIQDEFPEADTDEDEIESFIPLPGMGSSSFSKPGRNTLDPKKY